MKTIKLLAWLCEDTDRSLYDDDAPAHLTKTRVTMRERDLIDQDGYVTQVGRDYLSHVARVSERCA